MVYLWPEEKGSNGFGLLVTGYLFRPSIVNRQCSNPMALGLAFSMPCHRIPHLSEKSYHFKPLKARISLWAQKTDTERDRPADNGSNSPTT
jgi:hypothetical protein